MSAQLNASKRKVAIEDLLLVTTYRCNSRCVMCHIWMDDPDWKQELKPGELAGNLPASLGDINISGGEPFLRTDIPEFYSVCRENCPKAHVVISTNGLLTDRILEQTKRMFQVDRKIAYGISLDGLDEMHDQMRGIPGGFKKGIDTVRALKGIGVHDIRIAFTVTSSNFQHLGKVYDLARKEGVQFTAAVAHDSDHYFKIRGNALPMVEEVAPHFDRIVHDEMRTMNPRRWFRGYFFDGLKEYVGTRERRLPCSAGRLSAMVDPYGNVFSCNIMNWKMGNIREKSLGEILLSERGAEVQKDAAACTACWMVCTARTALKSYPFKVGSWVIRHKLMAHLSPSPAVPERNGGAPAAEPESGLVGIGPSPKTAEKR
jgi:MoaA/NifB/PqqE/SkfB family radical SAM enzyme